MHERLEDRLDTASALIARFGAALASVEELEASMSAKEKHLTESAEKAHASWQKSLGEWSGAHAIAVARVDAAAKQLAAEGEPRLAVRFPLASPDVLR